MSESRYRNVLENIVWSYSKLETYNNCPYKFFLKYIYECTDTTNFYASYGSFMHKLIEMYYRGFLKKENMLSEFLTGFDTVVGGVKPSNNIVCNYIKQGVNYLRDFTPFDMNVVDIEKKIEFKIDKYNFVGIIDFIGEKDGEIYIIDHKSRNLKKRSGRSKPTVKDRELDNMLKQLYIYSAAIEQEYGRLPDKLCFNCFRTNTVVTEQFDIEKHKEATEWAVNTIEDILKTEDFYPQIDYFSCKNICGVNNDCDYYNMNKGKR